MNLKDAESQVTSALSAEMFMRWPAFKDYTHLQRATLLEFETLLAGYLLSSQGDRMTSAFGVEGRYPFLDHELVHFALSLPTDLRLRNRTEEKHILKLAYADQVPRAILARKKQPYRAPDAQAFLNEESQPWLSALTSPDRLMDLELVNHDKVSKFLTTLKAKDPRRIAPREDQAFVLLISLLCLQERFISRRHGCGALPSSPPKKIIIL